MTDIIPKQKRDTGVVLTRPLAPTFLSLPIVLLLFLAPLFVTNGYAHATAEMGKEGFRAGFFHPLSGTDHILAMVSVGLWGAFLGLPSIWMLPVIFPLIMSLGAVYGILGFPLPFVEMGIVVSVIVLGLVIALKLKPSLMVSNSLVASFAIFHGYAHGAELPKNADALGYCIGFVVATGMLHLTGIILGLVTRFPQGDRVLQGGGFVISGVGVYLLVKLITG